MREGIKGGNFKEVNNLKEKRTKHIKLLNLAEQEEIDLLILPENCKIAV